MFPGRNSCQVCGQSYREKRQVNETQIILPSKVLKKDMRYKKDNERK